MKMVYAGGTICDHATLKRLVVISDEIGFIDRPAVTFNNWGHIGAASPFRRIDTSGAPIAFSVHSTPSGPINRLYQSYIEADLQNPRFIQQLLAGLQNDPVFAARVIQLDGNYSAGHDTALPARKGREIISTLLADEGLLAEPLSGNIPNALTFNTYSQGGRRETLKALLIEASIHVTNALLVSERTGLVPVCDDPYLCRLIAIRTYDSHYVAETPRYAPHLGLAVAKSVLPDKLLSEVEIPDLFAYRRAAKDAYDAWSAEINRLAARFEDIDPETAEQEITKMLHTDVNPRLIEYRNEMKSARDKLFGELVKKVMRWEMPTLSLTYLANLDFASALVAFATAAVPTLHSVVDYIVERRDIRRRNWMSYLIGIADEGPDDR